ncbi:MAG: hypothetical protein LBP40_00060 [Campylobacteraceae bacterium]|jgi:hypothetical protein|nr:hypothetical protein [Campylobacteraceae bacterium]
MIIQLISYKTIISKDIKCSNFNNPQSPDDFNINIIDLNNDSIWRWNSDNSNTIDNFNDFTDISKMISGSKKTKIVIVYPQNHNCLFYRSDRFGYHEYKDKLKNHLPVLLNIINTLTTYDRRGGQDNAKLQKMADTLTKLKLQSVLFEKTETTIDGIKFLSDFRFDTIENLQCLTKSDISEKSTTIKLQHPYNKIEIILTTLYNITKDEKSLQSFLKHVRLVEIKEEEPKWIKLYNKFDDKEIKVSISENEKTIAELQQKIIENSKILTQNSRWKSILYEQGENLVIVVLKILEKLLNYDFLCRKDNFEEDFLIEKEDIIFIGEIKGVNTNVKGNHISQTLTHCDKYKDELENKGDNKEVKGLLVINHQRDKPT